MREMEFCACLRNASDIKFGFEKIFLKELWLQCEVFSGNINPALEMMKVFVHRTLCEGFAEYCRKNISRLRIIVCKV